MGLIPLKLASALTLADHERISRLGQQPPENDQPKEKTRASFSSRAVIGHHYLRRRIHEVDGFQRSRDCLADDDTRAAMHDIRDLFDRGMFVECAKLCQRGLESYKVTVCFEFISLNTQFICSCILPLLLRDGSCHALAEFGILILVRQGPPDRRLHAFYSKYFFRIFVTGRTR